MRNILLGLSLGLFAGCNESQTSNTTQTPAKPSQTVSAQKPDTTDDIQQTSPQKIDPTTADRTNTAVNARDRSDAVKTPIDQNENQKDIDITAKIRAQVVKEELSTNAHNSKIITQDGKVTLRGPVQSEAEKEKIEKIAIEVAGADNVDNQLEVQP